MKLIQVLFLSLICFLLSACNTALLWDDRKEINTSYQSMESDQIIAFGMLKSTQQIVMIGEKYLFINDLESSKLLKSLIDAKIQSRLYIYYPNVILSQDGQTWKTKDDGIEIGYSKPTQEDIVKLQQLGFKQATCNKCTNYVQEYSLQGKFYKKGDIQIAESGKLREPLIIIIYSGAKSVEGVGSTLSTVALTPLAIVADLVTLPFQLLFLGSDIKP